MGLRATAHPPHMLHGKLHASHARHARHNLQEDSSATGIRNCWMGNCSAVRRYEPVWQLVEIESKARRIFPGPRPLYLQAKICQRFLPRLAGFFLAAFFFAGFFLAAFLGAALAFFLAFFAAGFLVLLAGAFFLAGGFAA